MPSYKFIFLKKRENGKTGKREGRNVSVLVNG